MLGTYFERRREERTFCNRDYFCSIMSGNLKFECKLLNVSTTGACILTNIPLKSDDLIILHIIRGRDIPFKCKVAWIKESTYGLEFFLETSDDFTNISFIINNHIR